MIPILILLLLCAQVTVFKSPTRTVRTNVADAMVFRARGAMRQHRQNRTLPPNLRGFKLRWTQKIKRDKGSVCIYTPWYFKREMGYFAATLAILTLIAGFLYFGDVYELLPAVPVPMVMGTAWVDGNTAAAPTADDMDGGGTDLATGDTVNITKALVIDKSVGCGNLTTPTLTVSATFTLTMDAGSTLTTTNACTVSGTLTCGNATVSCTGTGCSGGWSLLSSGTFTGGTGASHTFGSAKFSGTVTFTTGTTTINSAESNNIALLFDSETFDDGNGTVTLTRAGTQYIANWQNDAMTFYNVTVNNASCAFSYYASKSFALTVANNLTITAGSFTTWDGTTSANLTVTGATSITGTLDCKASTVSLGSGLVGPDVNGALNITGTFSGGSGTHTIGSIVLQGAATSCTLTSGTTTLNGATSGGWTIRIANNSATFNANSGTISYTYGANSSFGTSAGSALTWSLNNLIMNSSGYTLGIAVSVAATTVNTTIAGTLTVTAGTVSGSGVTSDISNITVTGASSITGTAFPTIPTSGGLSCTFNGAVTVNSGGTLGGATAWTCDLNSTINCVSGGTVVLPRTWTVSGATVTLAGTTTANSCTLTWDGTVAQSNTGAMTVSFCLISNASAIVTLTSVTANGTSGANWNQQQICVSTGAHVQGASCTATTIGMQATSGSLILKDGSSNFTIYGIRSSESASTGYKAASVTGNLTLKNADAYSTSFNTAYTLGAAMANVDTITIPANTTLTSGAYAITSSAAFAISALGTLTVSASGSLTIAADSTNAGTLTIDGTLYTAGYNINSASAYSGTIGGTGEIISASSMDWSDVYMGTLGANSSLACRWINLFYTTVGGGAFRRPPHIATGIDNAQWLDLDYYLDQNYLAEERLQ